jgi:hypothetical protein
MNDPIYAWDLLGLFPMVLSLGFCPPSTALLPHSPRRRLAQPPGKARVVAAAGGSSSLTREGLRLERHVALDNVRLAAECTPGRRPWASSAEAGGCGGCAGCAAAGAAASSEVGGGLRAVRSDLGLSGQNLGLAGSSRRLRRGAVLVIGWAPERRLRTMVSSAGGFGWLPRAGGGGFGAPSDRSGAWGCGQVVGRLVRD